MESHSISPVRVYGDPKTENLSYRKVKGHPGPKQGSQGSTGLGLECSGMSQQPSSYPATSPPGVKNAKWLTTRGPQGLVLASIYQGSILGTNFRQPHPNRDSIQAFLGSFHFSLANLLTPTPPTPTTKILTCRVTQSPSSWRLWALGSCGFSRIFSLPRFRAEFPGKGLGGWKMLGWGFGSLGWERTPKPRPIF